MSRAWVTTLAVGILLLAAFAVVEERYWPGLSTERWWVIGLVLLAGVYGACFAAVSIPRIFDPSESIPVLAWIVMAVSHGFGVYARSTRRQEIGDPNYLDDTKDEKFGPADDRHHMGRGWAIFATLFALGMMASSVALSRYFAAHPVEPPAATTRTQPAAPKPAAGNPRDAPRPPKTILEVTGFEQAIAFALPSMTDDRKAPSAGAKLLASWAAAHLTWDDAVVPVDETSLEFVEKDPVEARGKRLCVSGTLARIEKQTVAGTELHSARLVAKTGDAVELFAVGNTGLLVKRKPARFCGVVTGRLDVAGKPATFAVGMFEILPR
jgi:hypothetical protein